MSLAARLACRRELRVRETLAESLERAVAEVDRPLRRGGAAVAIDRGAVAEAAPLVLEVATLLRAGGPVPAEAMRLARALVGDGAGPLYSASPHRSEYPRGTLARYARAILADCKERVPLRQPGEFVRG